MCVREDGCGGAEILDLGESRHELGPCDATSLVDQLDGRPFAVVGHAVADEHVEFAVVVLMAKTMVIVWPICIQQPTLSPAKSARTTSSMSTGNGRKVTDFSYWSCHVQRNLRA